jgi:hypothetical protein
MYLKYLAKKTWNVANINEIPPNISKFREIYLEKIPQIKKKLHQKTRNFAKIK